MPLAKDEKHWNQMGWKVLKFCIIAFTVMGFLGSAAGVMGTGGITINGKAMNGWSAVWTVTLACTLAGALFGAVWLFIFKALALASKG